MNSKEKIDHNLLLKAYAITNIGEIHRRQDNLELAETNLNQALQLFDIMLNWEIRHWHFKKPCK